MNQIPISWVLLVIEGILLVAVGTLESVYEIYAAMAIGHLAKKHRVGWSFAAYIGIRVVLQTLAGICITLFTMTPLADLAERFRVGFSDAAQMHMTLLGMLLLEILLTGVFFLVTERILSTRLNLE